MGRRIATVAVAVVGAVAISAGAVALSTRMLDTEPQQRDRVGEITATDLAVLAPRTTLPAEVQGVVVVPGATPGDPPVTLDDAPADVPAPPSAPTTTSPPRVSAPAAASPAGATSTPTTVDDHGGSSSGSGSGSSGHGGADD